MSLTLEKNEAELTVFGFGWDDASIDSGEGETEEGSALEDFVNDLEYDPETDTDFSTDDIPGYDPDNPGYDPDTGLPYDLTYDFGENFNWDALAENLNINLDLDGNIDVDQIENLTQEITNLAHNEEAIYNYMTDHVDSTGIPARIRVTNPPDKLEYNDGDEIDYSGIIVCAYSSLTTRTPFIRQEWDGPRHNQIPFSELTFPVAVAERSTGEIMLPEYPKGGDVITITSIAKCRDMIYGLFKKNGLKIRYESTYLEQKTEQGFDECDTTYGDRMLHFYIGRASYEHDEGFDNVTYVQVIITYLTVSIGDTIIAGTHCGRNFYWNINGHREGDEWVVTAVGPFLRSNYDADITFVGGRYSSYVITSTYSYSEYKACNLNIEEVNSSAIPVQWQTEYREEPYEASFEIQVT